MSRYLRRASPWLCAVCIACSDPAPAPPPGTLMDSGDDDDSGVNTQDAAVYVRPDGGPRLPRVDADVTLPFLAPTQTVIIEIEASLRSLDVHFSIDTTASFNEEIRVLQRDLSKEVVPELRRRVDDVSIGVSSFEDFPHSPFGGDSDDPFELQTAITSDLRVVDNALAGLDRPIGNGADGPESGAEALYQVATGEGYKLGSQVIIEPYDGRALRGGGTLGGVGFRAGALHAVVHITDAPTHTPRDYAAIFPDTHSLEQAGRALAALDIRTLGVVTQGEEPDASQLQALAELQRVAIQTGAVTAPVNNKCATGIDGDARDPVNGTCPLVFEVRDNGNGLSDALTDAIVSLVEAVQLRRAYTDVFNDPLHFITSVEAIDVDVPRGQDQPERADERPSDGVDDTFVDVRPGTTLRFAVHMRNTLLVPDDVAQFYSVVIELYGDGLSLGSRTIRVQIPARTPTNAGDAGLDASQQDDASGM